MNAKFTALTLALIATTTTVFAEPAAPGKTGDEVRAAPEQAHAQGQPRYTPEFVEFANVPSAKSRAQVRAELAQAQPAINSQYVEPPRITSGKSRDEVRAEVEQAYAQGKIGYTPEFVEFTNVASTRSRDEVREEAVRAAKVAHQHGDSSGN